LRPLHRDHHAQPEAGDQEEPQGPPPHRAVPRGEDPGLLPAGLSEPAHEVRARTAVAARARRRHATLLAGRASRPVRRPEGRVVNEAPEVRLTGRLRRLRGTGVHFPLYPGKRTPVGLAYWPSERCGALDRLADMTDDAAPTRHVPLDAEHRALGGRMVPFAGWDMPIRYGSVLDEH